MQTLMYQEKLIQQIQKKIAPTKSIIEAIANALDISYDAAHRRISMKSKFSIEETVQLASYFGLSLDKMFQNSDHVLVKKTTEIQSIYDLSNYLESSFKSLTEFKADLDTTLYYSAKDIPLFYTINTGLLSQFKKYVWLNLLSADGLDVSFEAFLAKTAMDSRGQKLHDFYAATKVKEIWNDTTINSTLQQIMYFSEAGLLRADNGKMLCDQVKELLFALEKECLPGNERYQLYYHELLILNNNVLVSDKFKKSLFVPHTMLGYFITSDADTCQQVSNFYQHQLKNSRLLNTAGTRDKKVFFNKAYQKIDLFKARINALNEI